MLQGSGFEESRTKQIFLANQKASEVIEFFEFFYTWMRKEVDGKTSFYFFYSICIVILIKSRYTTLKEDRFEFSAKL